VTNRNKESLTLDLHKEDDRDVMRQLLGKADVFVTNFRPASLERWGLDYRSLEMRCPRLVMLQVSGFGNEGPYRDRPGFARIAEAFAGLTYITGYPDAPPTFAGYPIADGMAAVFGAFGVMLALREREHSGRGQLIDLPLYAPILRMLEHLVIGYEELGIVPERQGSVNPVVAPNNIYQTRDKIWIILPASTQTMFERVARMVGCPHWLDDPRFRSNADRIQHREELESAIAEWIGQRPFDEVVAALSQYDIAWGKINSMADVCRDPNIRARGEIVQVFDAELNRHLAMQGVIPRLTRTPGQVRWPGPPLGADTQRIMQELIDGALSGWFSEPANDVPQ
jgi:crotonobetainyl-CoA:carnitine CoA-transferase CaiB-like acyl-CoA transferase